MSYARAQTESKEDLDRTYFASQAMGVKSSLCLVLKIMFFVLISRMVGGWSGVAMANRASRGGLLPLLLRCGWRWPRRNLRRP